MAATHLRGHFVLKECYQGSRSLGTALKQSTKQHRTPNMEMYLFIFAGITHGYYKDKVESSPTVAYPTFISQLP